MLITCIDFHVLSVILTKRSLTEYLIIHQGTKLMPKQPTNQELSQEIKGLSGQIQDILETINNYADQNDQRLDRIESKLGNHDSRFESIDARFNKIESKMVTKDYLDEKLMGLRGDLIVLMRQGNNKFLKLVDNLHQRKTITEACAQQIRSMEPFPQSS